MTRNIDELNNLKTKKVKEPEEYFGEMDIPKEDKEERINFANEAKELFDVILILLLTMRDKGEVNYLYARELLETWLISLINKFVEPDDYTIDFASETAYNFVDTTKKHIDEDRFFSEDRAIINAENSANAIIEYKRYIEALSKGKTEKEWVTKRDNKERESHKRIDGTRIGILKTFDVGGVPMRFPMDTLFGDAPQETVNCRCHCDYFPKDDKKVEKNDESKQNKVDNISNNGNIKSNLVPYVWHNEEGTARYNEITKEYEGVVANRKVTHFMLKPGTKHYEEFTNVGYDPKNPEKLLSDLLLQFDINKRIEVEEKTDKIEWAQIMQLGVTKKKRFRTAWTIDSRFDGIPRLMSAYRENAK